MIMTNIKTLDKKKNFFKNNGVIVFRSLFSKNLINKCLIELEKFNSKKHKKNKNIVFDISRKKKYIRYFQYLNVYVKSFEQFLNGKILNLSSILLNDTCYFSSMGYHNKVPGAKLTPPHQDNFYWCRKPNKALTAYIALNDQSNTNGGIEYFLKSHKLKTFDHNSSKIKAFSSFIDEKKIPKLKIFKPVLKAGDVIFHHCNIIHKASQNDHKKKDRKALAIAIYSSKSKIDLSMKKKYLKNRKSI